MTEFRKHKNGKAFPITPRKAYGESRAPAEEVVQELRKKGMRARLIKTNRKKDLYAPYKGVLPVEEKDMPRDKDYTPVQGNTEMKELSSTKLNEMDDYAETIRSKHGISGGVFDPKKVMFVVKTPEQEEIVQSIIDEINKKYGVNYSFSETRPSLRFCSMKSLTLPDGVLLGIPTGYRTSIAFALSFSSLPQYFQSVLDLTIEASGACI